MSSSRTGWRDHPVLWVLGAGASACSEDVMLGVYRGAGAPDDVEESDMTDDERLAVCSVRAAADADALRRRGVETTIFYELLRVLSPPGSMVLTQNVDGLALALAPDLDVVEIHRRDDGSMILTGGTLSVAKLARIGKFIKRCRPRRVFVVGTTLSFPYLRTLISRAKGLGAGVCHINPDPEYRTADRVRRNERWRCTGAIEGLLLEFYPEYVSDYCDVPYVPAWSLDRAA
jgi:hypothetical protein